MIAIIRSPVEKTLTFYHWVHDGGVIATPFPMLLMRCSFHDLPVQIGFIDGDKKEVYAGVRSLRTSQGRFTH